MGRFLSCKRHNAHWGRENTFFSPLLSLSSKPHTHTHTLKHTYTYSTYTLVRAHTHTHYRVRLENSQRALYMYPTISIHQRLIGRKFVVQPSCRQLQYFPCFIISQLKIYLVSRKTTAVRNRK